MCREPTISKTILFRSKVAADLLSGEQVIFDRVVFLQHLGPVCLFRQYFPCRTDTLYLVDGVLNNFPVDLCRDGC